MLSNCLLRSLTLEVLAQDEGPNSSPVLARVNINVRDVNDNAPRIVMMSHGARIHGNESVWEVTVMENSANGTELCELSVIDLDSGQAGRVHCRVNQIPQSFRRPVCIIVLVVVISCRVLYC